MYFFNKLDFYIIRGAVRNGRGSTPVRCSTTTTKATCTIMKSVTVPLGTSSPRQVCFDSCLFFMQIICDIFEYFYVYKLKNVPPIKFKFSVNISNNTISITISGEEQKPLLMPNHVTGVADATYPPLYTPGVQQLHPLQPHQTSQGFTILDQSVGVIGDTFVGNSFGGNAPQQQQQMGNSFGGNLQSFVGMNHNAYAFNNAQAFGNGGYGGLLMPPIKQEASLANDLDVSDSDDGGGE